jgi:flagellar export protein FliJ
MAFRFSLATVLMFRESVEKREELALQKILLDISRTRQEIERITAQIKAAQDARNEAMLEPLPASHVQDMLIEIGAAKERKKKMIESLAVLEREHRQQALKYQAAHRDRQMLSDMKARQRESYDQEHDRAAQKFLDDIFAARMQRN